jgi:hypothetical protein
MDLRIALSPVVFELPEHTPRTAQTPRRSACYKRRNDDCDTSFRNRDNVPPQRLFQAFGAVSEALD